MPVLLCTGGQNQETGNFWFPPGPRQTSTTREIPPRRQECCLRRNGHGGSWTSKKPPKTRGMIQTVKHNLLPFLLSQTHRVKSINDVTFQVGPTEPSEMGLMMKDAYDMIRVVQNYYYGHMKNALFSTRYNRCYESLLDMIRSQKKYLSNSFQTFCLGLGDNQMRV